jgi:Na+-transporting methylmalonyl-CoA/oxaloacetate decarboxylase gamma subunit
MFSKELTELLLQVIKSWQVIAVTIALIVYMYLVGYVARSYHRPRSVSKSKPKKAKSAPQAVPETLPSP